MKAENIFQDLIHVPYIVIWPHPRALTPDPWNHEFNKNNLLKLHFNFDHFTRQFLPFSAPTPLEIGELVQHSENF